jgi:hypothetical protein
MPPLHLITCEYPPLMGGVSEHSRVLAQTAAAAGYEVQVWTGASGAASNGIRVRPDLGDFSAAALERADAALNACAAPRRLIVQWVPHGYGRRGLNVPFSRWLRRRSRAGDRIDLIVHEPFVDLFGSSWRQPVMGLVQRYMTWTLVRAADRVWLTIPGWEPRLRIAWRADRPAPQTLPVPGTIPVVEAPAEVGRLRQTLLDGRSGLVGYFGTGSSYVAGALKTAVAALAEQRPDTAVVCFGRGSDRLADSLRGAAPGSPVRVTGTGAIALDRISLHLQACDVLLQPYPDGVSGRRTTTVSALEHAVPIATTIGALSEPFWNETRAIEGVAATSPDRLPSAVIQLLDPVRNQAARDAALAFYRERFDPVRTFEALLRA